MFVIRKRLKVVLKAVTELVLSGGIILSNLPKNVIKNYASLFLIKIYYANLASKITEKVMLKL